MDRSNNVLVRIWRILVNLIRHPQAETVWLGFRVMKSLIARTRYGKVTFYPDDQLPWALELESNWKVIRTEMDAVLTNLQDVPNAQDDYRGQEALTQDDKWKTFTLFRDGRKSDKNSGRCPETAKIIEKIPGLVSAMFSILAPHKHLPAHCGPYGGLLNCHLGLRVPENRAECRIRVGNDMASWEAGRLLVFDDSNEHEVWNDSETIRVVLLMYVIRPLPFPISLLNRIVIILPSLILRESSK